MKILYVMMFITLLLSSFCAQQGDDKKPKLVKASLESSGKDKPKYVIAPAYATSGDTLIFTSRNISMATTIIIPRADVLCETDSTDKMLMIEGITYLFIPLVKKDDVDKMKHWTSRKFIINKHGEQTTYEYSAYVHAVNEMAEGKSSPKIIVNP